MRLSKQLNRILAMILLFITSFIIYTSIAQKGGKQKTPQELKLDSIVNASIQKNEKFIVKRVGQLKEAEKKCDSLTQVVTELKQEINEKTNTDDDGVDVGGANLLPISKDKGN
jgi:cell division protein FtsB